MINKFILTLVAFPLNFAICQNVDSLESKMNSFWNIQDYKNCLIFFDSLALLGRKNEKDIAFYRPVLLQKNGREKDACEELKKGIYAFTEKNELKEYRTIVEGIYPDFKEYKKLSCYTGILLKIDSIIQKMEIAEQKFATNIYWGENIEKQCFWSRLKLLKKIKKHRKNQFLLTIDKRPVIVQLPTKYKQKNQYDVITFLHGGANNLDDYFPISEQLCNQAIFEFAKEKEKILIYPLSNKNVGGWFEDSVLVKVEKITELILSAFRVNPKEKKIIGFSNGGTAVLELATFTKEKQYWNKFISLNPEPLPKKQTIEQLISGSFEKNLLSIHSLQDKSSTRIQKMYSVKKNSGWNALFLDIQHGFIFGSLFEKNLFKLLIQL